MKLSDNIYLVASGAAGVGISNPYDCNVYLVDCGKGFALIDCGVGLDTELIAGNIAGYGFSLRDCGLIFITHAHADHAGGARWLAERTGARILALEESARYITAGDTQAISLQAAIRAGVYPGDYRFHSCPVKAIEDNQQITLGNVTFTAIATPGHSGGHCAFLARIDGKSALFAGDVVFPGGKISLQPIWDCVITDYAKTLARLAALEVDALIPSHHGFVLSGGAGHIKIAHDLFQRLAVPPNAG